MHQRQNEINIARAKVAILRGRLRTVGLAYSFGDSHTVLWTPPTKRRAQILRSHIANRLSSFTDAAMLPDAERLAR